ncbi:MAG: helix-turn-helix domain-containing protein [Protaetiibacter sp.]
MGRWEPGARARLREAALELFLEQGFDRTTVAEIAERAGVTERTFFRHHRDKREVLFEGQDALSHALADTIRDAAPDASSLAVVGASLTALEEFFSLERRPYSRRRQRVIDAESVLREREQLKLATLADEAAAAFRERGADEATALLLGQTVSALLTVAFVRWVAPDEERGFAELAAEAVAGMRAVAAG